MPSAAGTRVSPGNLADLCGAVQTATDHGFAVTSGGNTATSGNLISLEKLNKIELDEEAGVVRAGAGAFLSTLRSTLEKKRLSIPGLSATVRSERVGSLVARGEVARRALCGIEAVLTTGEVVKHGGTVQKDVAGYDIASVLLGSQGRLAVISEVVFRVCPEKAGISGHEAAGEVAITPVPGLAQAFDPSGALSRE